MMRVTRENSRQKGFVHGAMSENVWAMLDFDGARVEQGENSRPYLAVPWKPGVIRTEPVQVDPWSVAVRLYCAEEDKHPIRRPDGWRWETAAEQFEPDKKRRNPLSGVSGLEWGLPRAPRRDEDSTSVVHEEQGYRIEGAAAHVEPALAQVAPKTRTPEEELAHLRWMLGDLRKDLESGSMSLLGGITVLAMLARGPQKLSDFSPEDLAWAQSVSDRVAAGEAKPIAVIPRVHPPTSIHALEALARRWERQAVDLAKPAPGLNIFDQAREQGFAVGLASAAGALLEHLGLAVAEEDEEEELP